MLSFCSSDGLRHLRASARVVATLVVSGCTFAGSPDEGRNAVFRSTASSPLPVSLTSSNGVECQGVLARPDTILTVAHCLYPEPDFVSVAFPGGEPQQQSRRFVRNPGYGSGTSDKTGLDTARVRIAPIGHAGEILASREVFPGETLTLMVSRSGSIVEKPCQVLGQTAFSIEMKCRVETGWSGAPVFSGSGRDRRLVGLLSGKGTGAEAGIAVATSTAVLKEGLNAVFIPIPNS